MNSDSPLGEKGYSAPRFEGKGRLWGTVALSLATFMSVLDVSIANVSIAAIAGDLGVSPNQGTAIITSFGIAMAISMPLTGWLAERFGTVRLLITSLLIFASLSVLCATAPTFESLVVLRVLQGGVAGPIIPLCQALVLRSYHPSRVGFGLTALSLTTFAAPVIGPLLGGWLTDNWTWRGIFYVNVPLGLACAAIAFRVLRPIETPIYRNPVDAMGLALLICWIGSLQLMLDLGRNRDWFSSPLVMALAVSASSFFVFFMVWERTEKDPIIDLALFRIRTFSIGTLTSSLAYALHLGNMVLLPLWLLQYMGYSATMAGVVLAPIGIAGILVVPFVGRYISRFDVRWMVTASFLLFALSLWMRSRFSTDSDLASLMLPSLIQGAGSAMFFMPLLTIILSNVPSHRVAAASGLSTFLRYMAAAVGTSLIAAAWSWRAALHRSRLVEAVPGSIQFEETRSRLDSVGIQPQQQLAIMDRLIEQQAHTLAVNDLFYSSSLLFLVLVGAIWLAKPPPVRRHE